VEEIAIKEENGHSLHRSGRLNRQTAKIVCLTPGKQKLFPMAPCVKVAGQSRFAPARFFSLNVAADRDGIGSWED
jgi:hypothetical protein